MLRRFIDWWNKKPYSEDEKSKYQKDVYPYSQEEEFHYETTLNLDLKRISNLLTLNFPHTLVENFNISKVSSTVRFRTRDLSAEIVKDTIPMESLAISRMERDLKSNWRERHISSYDMYDDILYWEASFKEYEELYKPYYQEYIDETIKPLLSRVEVNYKNKLYFYIFTKYEDSIHIVYNALKDAKEQSGEISDELFQKSSVIVEKLKDAMDKKTGEIDYIEKLQQEAVSKSLIDRLDNEIEFIDNYIEVN